MRKIPTTMATQHPDNAAKPYWHTHPFISTAAEVKECYLSYSDLGIDEYNWDWEGKFVDEAVVDRLIHKYHDYFSGQKLGEDKFLTFRIPNPRIEKQFRVARAFMVIVTSSQLSQSLGFKNSPIFETILPLTENASEILEIQKAFRDLVSIEHKLLKMKDSLQHIEIIPLFEQVRKIMGSGNILLTYLKHHKKAFGYLPAYLRPYCARSDPALNSGLVPTILSLKVALSEYQRIEKTTGVRLYPMLGTGTLPFRGGLSPENLDTALEEYAGVATLTVQSAFRYDFNKSVVKNAIRRLKKELPQRRAVKLSVKEIKNLKESIILFETPYRSYIEKTASLINTLSDMIPKRRERLLHVGLFGYSRGIGKVKLPRAIPFTASLYSLGIPPEIIGTGRGITASVKKGLWESVSSSYIHMKENLLTAGFYLNRENIARLAKSKNYWNDVLADITGIEKAFGIELGPQNRDQREHYKLTGNLLKKLEMKKEVGDMITYGGILRKSLG